MANGLSTASPYGFVDVVGKGGERENISRGNKVWHITQLSRRECGGALWNYSLFAPTKHV